MIGATPANRPSDSTSPSSRMVMEPMPQHAGGGPKIAPRITPPSPWLPPNPGPPSAPSNYKGPLPLPPAVIERSKRTPMEVC